MLSRQDIEGIQPGTWVQDSRDVPAEGPVPAGARWRMPRQVVRVFARGISVRGRAYVCYDTTFGPTSTISGSAAEGEHHVRVLAREEAVRIVREKLVAKWFPYGHAFTSEDAAQIAELAEDMAQANRVFGYDEHFVEEAIRAGGFKP